MLKSNNVYLGDCLEVMKDLDDNSIDAILTDPPYGINFMGKQWDHTVPGIPFWAEMLRVAKPGTHMLVFGGTRTHHRLMVAIEDAGWEIRDTLGWIYGSGFPKSLDVSKAIDKAAGELGEFGDYKTPDHAIKRKPGNERMAEGWQRPWRNDPEISDRNNRQYLPSSDTAKQWNGWGTALKPAWEPIILCRKPLEGTVAENVQKWETGGLNIDGCRVGINGGTTRSCQSDFQSEGIKGQVHATRGYRTGHEVVEINKGRFPANLIHDGSDEVVGLFPESKGQCAAVTGNEPTANGFSGAVKYGGMRKRVAFMEPRGDSGSAARFFYTAKADSTERNKHLTEKNKHPTVKPVDLLRYLCRLITPPKGIVLDPFCGSGSTGVAAFEEGFNYILIDKDPESCKTAKIRCAQVRL